MFIWFILRDDPTSAWQSGLLNRNGTKKPAYNTFSALAAKYDARSPYISVKAGVPQPSGQVRRARALVAVRHRRGRRH